MGFKISRRDALGGLAGLSAGLCLSARRRARAQDLAESFYRGRTLTFVVSSSAGGGYDLYARLVARYMQKYIPGAPTIVVQNMTGAGGLAAANYLVNVAPTDGSTIGQIQNTVPFQTLFGQKGAQFDPLKLRFLGSANSEVAVAFTWWRSPVKTLEDLMQRPTVMAAATGAISAIDGAAMNRLLGTKIKLVMGYPGASESFLAIERGEADGFPAIYWSTLKASKPEWIADKRINILVQLALAKAPDLPNVPLISEVLHDDAQRDAFNLLFTPQALGRPFVVAPTAPADRLAILRSAFEQALRDPQLLADAKKLNLEIQLLAGADVEALVKKAYSAPKATIQTVESFIGGPG